MKPRALMIRIKGHDRSERYASYCARTWKAHGYDIEMFDATTPETIPEDGELVFLDKKRSIYDDPNRVRIFSPTEKAVWYSHFRIWKTILERDEPTIVLEHDAFLRRPELMKIDPREDFRGFSYNILAAYYIKPRLMKLFMKHFIEKKYEIEINPDGELHLFLHAVAGNRHVQNNRLYNINFNYGNVAVPQIGKDRIRIKKFNAGWNGTNTLELYPVYTNWSHSTIDHRLYEDD